MSIHKAGIPTHHFHRLPKLHHSTFVRQLQTKTSGVKLRLMKCLHMHVDSFQSDFCIHQGGFSSTHEKLRGIDIGKESEALAR